MKFFKSKQSAFFICSFIAGLIFFCIFWFFSNKYIAAAFGITTLVFVIIYLIINRRWVRYNVDLLSGLTDFLGADEKESINSLGLPVLLCSDSFIPIWFNDIFKTEVLGGIDIEKYKKDLSSENILSEIVKQEGYAIQVNSREYRLYSSLINGRKYSGYVIFFFDITDLKNDADKYRKLKPSVMLGFYDNLDEMFNEYSESECNEIKNGIDRILDGWLSDYSCILRRIGTERFIVIAHENDMQSMIERKFDILGKVKEYKFEGKPCGVTFSIGVGRGGDMKESERMARQALDMALSRGGDQAAVKTGDSYEFFGGLAAGNNKTDKVRSRVMASAVSQVISNGNDIYIMGHRYSDMDSIGAALGIRAIAKTYNKRSYIVCDKDNCSAEKMIEEYVAQSGEDPFIPPGKAIDLVKKDDVVFVVDTHRKENSECPELLEKTKNIVVVDHHRKAVDYYDKAVVFHHDPNASSCCEMIAEMLMYVANEIRLTKNEAESMLAGIMLDTKSFVIRTGVRTFEAAAYLRGFGADSVKIRELFASTVEDYKIRNEIVSSAEIYKKTAISFADIECDDIRVKTSIAADELMNITDIDASFVLFKVDGEINISARSYGKMNVQIIMEQLGGGGHLTMAACRLGEVTKEEAIGCLKEEIDKYYNSLD